MLYQDPEVAELVSQVAAPRQGIAARTNSRNPPMAGAVSAMQMVPSRILVTPDRQELAEGEEVTSIIDFSGVGPGCLIGHRGSAVQSDQWSADEVVNAAEVAGLRMFFNSGNNIVTNGLNAQAVPFSDVYPSALAYAPLMRFVRNTDKLSVVMSHLIPTGTGTAITIVPSVSFQFVELPDFGDEMYRKLRLAGLYG